MSELHDMNQLLLGSLDTRIHADAALVIDELKFIVSTGTDGRECAMGLALEIAAEFRAELW